MDTNLNIIEGIAFFNQMEIVILWINIRTLIQINLKYIVIVQKNIWIQLGSKQAKFKFELTFGKEI